LTAFAFHDKSPLWLLYHEIIGDAMLSIILFFHFGVLAVLALCDIIYASVRKFEESEV